MAKKNNYPKERKPTGPRPMAGRPAIIDQPVTVSLVISQADRQWLIETFGNVSEGVRRLIGEGRKL